MDWRVFGVVVVWLGILSWFDIRKKEIPHCLWVIIPLVVAGICRVWLGDWTLVMITGLIIMISERGRISRFIRREEIGRLGNWFPLLFLALFLFIHTSSLAALSIVSFWMAWEVKWWGGADAVIAIILVLIMPEIILILAFLTAHALTSVCLLIVSLLRKKKVGLNRIPGIPLLLGSILLFQFSHAIFL